MKEISSTYSLDNSYRDQKSLPLVLGIHVLIFFSIFSFSQVSVEISPLPPTASFSMMSVSTPDTGVSEVVKNQKPTEQKNNSDSTASSEVIFDANHLNNPQPQYPLMAKRKGEEGTVMIRAFVDQNGAATKIEIAKSSSFSLLDNAALDAIKKMAIRSGQKIRPIHLLLSSNPDNL